MSNDENFIKYQLLVPFSYLFIKHEKQALYTLKFPFVLTLITIAFLCILPVEKIVGDSGVIAGWVSIISSFPSFFFAALVFIVAFGHAELDEVMSGKNPPTLKVRYHSGYQQLPMTRRRFLAVLFSFLVVASLLLSLGAKVFLKLEIRQDLFIYYSWFGVVIFTFLLWQMVAAIMLGIYYLADRLLTPH